MKTLKPGPNERWGDNLYPVIGIFGANASGKTSVLDALHYVTEAIRSSAGEWLGRKAMPRDPFRLDRERRHQPSTYELDFVHDERRYHYEFAVDSKGVINELLRDLPSTRWRTLVQREGLAGKVKLHSSLTTIGPVTERELVLSRAAMLGHEVLAPIARVLSAEVDIARVSYSHRERRLRVITDAVAEGSIDLEDVRSLLRVADVGIENVEVHEEALSDDLRELLALMRKKGTPIDIGQSAAVADPPENEDSQELDAATLDDSQADEVIRSLRFSHVGSDPTVKLDIRRESDGTLAWLALAVPALDALRWGGIYCIDEIDSSLHPHLVELLVTAFADPEINHHGAQLIFTTHESFLLSNLSDLELDPEQVWFAEKDRDGATTVFSLADFPRHKDANHAKRYLLGRYGATPRLSPSTFGKLVDAGAR